MDKKFSLIMPVYKTGKYLNRAIKSIIDQDYTNWELICVLDGPDQECEDIIKPFESDTRINHIVIEHGGACKARNAGARIATGDYYSFFSSDFKARAGMLATWAKALNDNPDCAFVYGGYGLLDDDKLVQQYGSESFNPYLLTCYNYIDGGFPVRKESYLEWDENCKSLNDWEWILRIVKAGGKGKFMGEITYDAEVPRPDGLSFDSSHNWLDRVAYIKEKNNIPHRDVCVVSAGAAFHAIRTAEMMGYGFSRDPFFKPNDYKAIWILGFFISSAEELGYMGYLVENALHQGKKVIIHWIGTDVLNLYNMTYNNIRSIKNDMYLSDCIHLCQSSELKEELADFGIKADVMTLPLDVDKYEVTPLPEKKSVAVYDPAINSIIYNNQLMNLIALHMPDVKFKFFGDPYKKLTTQNIEYVGHVDSFSDLIKNTSVLLRYTRHDGFPVTASEFIMSGRNVVTNVKMPHVKLVEYKNGDRLSDIVKRIITEIRSALELGLNTSGAEYYKKLHDPKMFKIKLEGYL